MRRYEIINTFEKMVEYASSNDAGVILIAGDMFDTISTSQRWIKDRMV